MEKLPSIALGTWSWGTGFAGGDQVFGNNLGVEELKPVFDEAMANGLNLWDSAVVYGMGASETVLSTFTKNCKREDVFISTVSSTLAVSNIRNRTYTNYEVYLIGYGYGKFKEKIHFME